MHEDPEWEHTVRRVRRRQRIGLWCFWALVALLLLALLFLIVWPFPGVDDDDVQPDTAVEGR
jgi:hypothetical protein